MINGVNANKEVAQKYESARKQENTRVKSFKKLFSK